MLTAGRRAHSPPPPTWFPQPGRRDVGRPTQSNYKQYLDSEFDLTAIARPTDAPSMDLSSVGSVVAFKQAQVSQQAALKATKVLMDTQKDQGQQAVDLLKAATAQAQAQISQLANGSGALDVSA